MTKDTKYNVDVLTKHSTNRPIYTKYPKTRRVSNKIFNEGYKFEGNFSSKIYF